MFTLEQYEDQAGAHLDLIPKAEIDREKVASIDLNLIASNPVPGSEASILPIHVTILDQNEFRPKFAKSVCSFLFSEILKECSKNSIEVTN